MSRTNRYDLRSMTGRRPIHDDASSKPLSPKSPSNSEFVTPPSRLPPKNKSRDPYSPGSLPSLTRVNDRRRVKKDDDEVQDSQDDSSQPPSPSLTPSSSQESLYPELSEAFESPSRRQPRKSPLKPGKDGDVSRENAWEKTNEISPLRKTPKENKFRYDTKSTIFLFLPIILGLFAVMYYLHFNSQSSSPNVMTDFRNGLKTKFANQQRRTWRTLEAPIRRVLSDGFDSREPAVLILAGDTSTVDCLGHTAAQLLAASLNDTFGQFLRVDGRKLSSMSELEAKNKMESLLWSHFGSGGRVAVVEAFDRLPPESSLLFHALADHESSPFKQAFLFLTFEEPFSVVGEENSVKTIEREIARYLYRRLSRKIGEDATAALMARIANNVVAVSKENDLGDC